MRRPADPPLAVRPARAGDGDAVIALWRSAGLVVPWNDPVRDIAFCRAAPTAELFVGESGGTVVATTMAGHDGHRGWLYYVAVAAGYRGRGIGRRIVRHAEAWLGARGVPKVQIMIRDGNRAVEAFYRKIGYEIEPRVVMAHRLRPRGK